MILLCWHIRCNTKCPTIFVMAKNVKSYGDIYNGRFQSENNHKWTIISICTFILKCHVLLITMKKKLCSSKDYPSIIWVLPLGASYLRNVPLFAWSSGVSRKTGVYYQLRDIHFICRFATYTWKVHNEKLKWSLLLYCCDLIRPPEWRMYPYGMPNTGDQSSKWKFEFIFM
jgi:hypothetical protein